MKKILFIISLFIAVFFEMIALRLASQAMHGMAFFISVMLITFILED